MRSECHGLKGAKYLKKDKIFSYWVKSDNKPLVLADLETMVEDVELNDKVPEEAAEALEVAKRTFVFGYFYYKLFTVSHHYAFLAVEAALKIKYKEVTGKESSNHTHVIEALVKSGVIPENKKELYDAGRYLRNELSHLTDSTTMTPSADILYRTAEMINDLYEEGGNESGQET